MFDSEFGEDERLPSLFEIHIRQRKSGQSYLQWNGVFIGNPLTDNILDPDGYRFHDVFHFAHAAVLHWSPTFRALIKHKRKSDTVIDEAQDVLVQREMEERRFLLSSIPPCGRGFSRHPGSFDPMKWAGGAERCSHTPTASS